MLNLNPGSPATGPTHLTSTFKHIYKWTFSHFKSLGCHVGCCVHPDYLGPFYNRLPSPVRCHQGQSKSRVIWDAVVLKTASIFSPGGSCSKEDLTSWDRDSWWDLAFVHLHLKTKLFYGHLDWKLKMIAQRRKVWNGNRFHMTLEKCYNKAE